MAKSTTNKGWFVGTGEPKSKYPITLRLPQALDEKLRATMAQPELIEWVRQAAVEKYQREKETL